MKTTIQAIHADITTFDVDAIVNAALPSLAAEELMERFTVRRRMP